MEPILGGGATATRARHHRKTPSSDRFLGVLSSSRPSTAGFELTEDDIFDSTAEPVASTSASASSNRNLHPNNHRARHQQQPRNQPQHLGILAALPASETHSVFNHKASATASVSSSSSSSSSAASSSSLMIPTVPNPRRPPGFNNRMKVFHQSAPVNVPTLSAAVAEERRRRRGFDYIREEDDEDVDNVKMLPPHEIVAAKQTPLLSCSVLEGAGRTLKGRDLRRVRNAVFWKTGLLD